MSYLIALSLIPATTLEGYKWENKQSSQPKAITVSVWAGMASSLFVRVVG